MEWTLVNFQDEEVRNNFEKLSRTHAKCKHCGEEVQHTTYIIDFLAHMEHRHKIISNSEKQKKGNLLWKYIREKPCQQGGGYCLLCQENIYEDSEDLPMHTHVDDNFTFMGNYYEEWQWKYFEQENDFTAKCYICSCEDLSSSYNIINFRWQTLMGHIRERHTHDLLQTMPLHFEDEDIQDNFEKSSHTDAKCRHCDQTFTHTKFTGEDFIMHVRDHKNIIDMEKKNNDTKHPSWKYMRMHIDNQIGLIFNCVFCKIDCMDETSSLNHTHNDWRDFNTFISTFYNRWEWKYYERANDSRIYCFICNSNIPTVFEWRDLMYHYRESHFDLLKTVTLNFIDDEIKESFIKLSFTAAKCKSCDLKFTHTLIEKFKKHIQNYHKDIIESNLESWKYIRRYRRGQEHQCVLCKAKVLPEDDNSNHTHENDENYTTLRIYYEQWEWKYREIKQKDDYKVKCYLCPREILIDFCKGDLMNHLKECGQQLPPLRVRGLRLNIQEQEILQKFTNFSNYKAQCRRCNKRIVHTNFKWFRDHLVIHHRDIHSFEEKNYQSSREYIKLCKDLPNQCVLCKGIIINNHDYLYHTHRNDNYTIRKIFYEKWELKYGERKSNNTMECNFCPAKITVSFHLNQLKNHLKTHENRSIDTVSPSSLAGTQQQDVSIEDTAGTSSLVGTQQHDIEDAAFPIASSLPGTSSLKKRKRDSSN